jgi:ribose transport system substrate-binding protein
MNRIMRRRSASRSHRAGRVAAVSLAIGALALAGCAGGGGAAGGDGEVCDETNTNLVMSFRGIDNEYYIAVEAGAKAFAESVGAEDRYQWIENKNDSAKQVAQITQILAESGKCTAINIDPNENVPAILNAAKKVGAKVVVQWTLPPGDVTPESYGSTFSAFMAENAETQGYGIAKALFESMGGKGNIVAIQGLLDNTAQQNRQAGLERALEEYPDITLLDAQPANWDRTMSQNLMQSYLTKYGDEINGVWAANDSLGLGALSALRAAGRDDVGVVGIDGLEESLKEIAAGDGTGGYIATNLSKGSVQGGIGLDIAYKAVIGEIDIDKEPALNRAFYLETDIITKENVEEALNAPLVHEMDFDDPYSVAFEPVFEEK